MSDHSREESHPKSLQGRGENSWLVACERQGVAATWQPLGSNGAWGLFTVLIFNWLDNNKIDLINLTGSWKKQG